MGSTYIELPKGLRNPMKGPINIKNNHNKCFPWCHIRHLNLVKTHLERITKEDKNMINDLNYEGVKFPVSKKDYCKIEQHCVKSIQIRSFFWSVFSCILTDYGDLLMSAIMSALMCSVMKMD